MKGRKRTKNRGIKMKDKILKKIAMIPDKIVIPFVLGLYVGLWIFTGTATRVVIQAWRDFKRICYC